MQDMRVYPVFVAKDLWCSGDESLLFVDQPGDIVGNASAGIGCVRAPLENRNFHSGCRLRAWDAAVMPAASPPITMSFAIVLLLLLLFFRKLGYPHNGMPNLVLTPAFQDKKRPGLQKFAYLFCLTAQETGENKPFCLRNPSVRTRFFITS